MFSHFQYFSDIAQNPETNQRPPASFVHSSGYLPAAATTNPTASSSGLYNSNSRETSPYSEFVNNGPTRIAMPYRVPDPVMPPWVTSTASVTSSTEHVYAVPARVIRSSEESVVSLKIKKSAKKNQRFLKKRRKLRTARRAKIFKKVQAKKLVKSNIAKKISVKFHIW